MSLEATKASELRQFDCFSIYLSIELFYIILEIFNRDTEGLNARR